MAVLEADERGFNGRNGLRKAGKPSLRSIYEMHEPQPASTGGSSKHGTVPIYFEMSFQYLDAFYSIDVLRQCLLGIAAQLRRSLELLPDTRGRGFKALSLKVATLPKLYYPYTSTLLQSKFHPPRALTSIVVGSPSDLELT